MKDMKIVQEMYARGFEFMPIDIYRAKARMFQDVYKRQAQVCGAAAVKDREYFESNVRKIVTTRERVKGELEKLGFLLTDSRANFLFARHPEYDAGRLFAVSYTHLDVYKRQAQARGRVDKFNKKYGIK